MASQLGLVVTGLSLHSIMLLSLLLLLLLLLPCAAATTTAEFLTSSMILEGGSLKNSGDARESRHQLQVPKDFDFGAALQCCPSA